MIHSVFGSGFFSHLFLSIVVIAFYYFYLGFCELLKSYFYLFTIFQLLLWLTEMLFLIFWSFYREALYPHSLAATDGQTGGEKKSSFGQTGGERKSSFDLVSSGLCRASATNGETKDQHQ